MIYEKDPSSRKAVTDIIQPDKILGEFHPDKNKRKIVCFVHLLLLGEKYYSKLI